MRVTDLMVGDWVNVNGLNLKVGAIHADEIGVFDPDYKIYWCSDDGLDRIDPIPLTEEILVKNGFVGVELTDSYELNTDYYEIEVWNYSDGLWVVNVHWIELSSTPESKATVSYVHQLQHLLRLCGIEKEILI